MMGQSSRKPSMMAETNSALPNISGPKLKVSFYGRQNFKTDPLFVPLNHPISCEDVCIQCADHLSRSLGRYFSRESEKTLGPMFLPMFGLYAADHSLQRWMLDGHVFDASQDNQEFYFRVRVRLVAEKIMSTGVFADYLFWQCAEDFLTGRVWDLFEEDNKIKDVDMVNRGALWVLIGSAHYQMHRVVTCHPHQLLTVPLKNLTTVKYIRQQVTLFNLHTHLPVMPPELKKEYNVKEIIMRVLSRNFMHKYIKEFFEKMGDFSLNTIRWSFIKHMMDELVLQYGSENFPAQKLERDNLPPTPVELNVKTHQEDLPPGFYLTGQYKSSLQDIVSVAILDSATSRSEHKCCVQLDIRYRPPLILWMADQNIAKSFASTLDTYYRLKVNYHKSLVSEPAVMAPSLKVLQMLKSFGPMEEDHARQHIQQLNQSREPRQQGNTLYMIYQDCLYFHLLHVVGKNSKQGGLENFTFDIHYVAAQNEHGFTFTLSGHEAEDKTFTDPLTLIFYLNTDLMLGRQAMPGGNELCGAMSFLKEPNLLNQYTSLDADVDGSSNRQVARTADQPTLFSEGQVTVTQQDLVVQREFCDVYRFKQMDFGREAILKKVTSRDPKVVEAYRKGADLLLKLGERHRFFVGVYGQMVTSPLRIVFESMPEGEGSLLTRLQDESKLPLNWQQQASVLKQLAECLGYLNESNLIYGSMCCSKILVYSEKDTEVIIRLGDPSVALFCDTLDITDAQNDKRLAWVAPERFRALSRHSMASEVYSFGTTIWEIISRGKDPTQYIPRQRRIQFFAEGHRLPEPEFTRVTATHGNVAQLPAATNDNWAVQWVRSQDFESGGAILGKIGLYSRAELQEPDSPDVSPSGTEMTTVQEEAECPDEATPDLQPATAEPTLATQADEDSDSVHVRLQQAVLKMMRDCWDSCPDRRPSPLDLLQQAVQVVRNAQEATKDNDLWHISMVIRTAVRTGNVQEQVEAQQLQQLVLQRERANQERQAELQQLEEQLSRSVNAIINFKHLDFSNSTILGSGHFGEVKSAIYRPTCMSREAERELRQQEGEKVAVKSLKNQSTDEIREFIKEALLVTSLQHHHVVQLKGIVLPKPSERRPNYLMVMEFADKGCLEDYVNSKAHCLGTLDMKKTLQTLACNVAEGLEYMCQTKKMIHGDIAARNVLLFSGQNGATLIAKLADFGLSHKVNKGASGQYYYDLSNSQTKIPIYGMPVEVLEKICNQAMVRLSIKTDVWSYGTLLWEMFSNQKPEQELVDAPFKQKSQEEILKHIKRKYAEGKRLTKPIHCPKLVYDIMRKCWERLPQDRPTFQDIGRMMEELTDTDLSDE